MRRTTIMRWAATLTVIAVLAGACGSDDSSGADAEAFDGVSVVVGSKNFTEQYVLGEILLQALAARGADVTDATDFGDSPATRAGLLAGDIDTYWEYNSTGWVQHLGQSDPADEGEQLTADVAELDRADNGIVWVGRSSFNDTYGFAMSPEVADEAQATRASIDAFNLDDMAELLGDDSDRVVCIEADFQTRADGLTLFESATDLKLPDDQIRVYEDEAEIYQEVADGVCDFGEIFTTDGRIDELELSVVVDPGIFYIYNVSLTMPESLYDQAPDAFDELVDDILNPMSQSRITDLNGRVASGEPVAEVAKSYLRDFNINP